MARVLPLGWDTPEAAMHAIKKSAAIVFVLAGCASVLDAAADPRKAFVENWEGARVAVRRTLHALVYDEHGRAGSVTRGRHEGLTVVTPLGMYFQFDGRDNESDLIGFDAPRMLTAVSDKYRRARALDVGSYQRIEPLMLARYEPGTEFVVQGVRVDRDRVRFYLAYGEEAGGDPEEVETFLTVQWPQVLSPAFSERAEIERLVGQFLAVAEQP
ncbi:MAG: hypothetical protein EHM13_12825 [Acidobacteria bacterium]|nr:MAG: hypothetical protein EHM13_12825 [Acidobacteriota bacterium]